MQESEYIKPIRYIGRLNKYYLNTYYINKLFKEGALKGDLENKRIKDTLLFLKDQNINSFFKKDITEEQREKTIKKTIDGMIDKNREDANNTMLILFNQTLVTLCTVLETYLTDTINTIIINNNKVLLILSGENSNILLKDFIQQGNYEDIFNNIKNKYLRKFTRYSISEKIEALNKIGIGNDKLFDMSSKLQKKFTMPLTYLKNTFRDRNTIVHEDLLVVRSEVDLEFVSEFFQFFILNSGIKLSEKFNLHNDLMVHIENPQKAKSINFDNPM